VSSRIGLIILAAILLSTSVFATQIIDGAGTADAEEERPCRSDVEVDSSSASISDDFSTNRVGTIWRTNLATPSQYRYSSGKLYHIGDRQTSHYFSSYQQFDIHDTDAYVIIESEIDKTYSCSDHYIMICDDYTDGWSWGGVSGQFKFVWNCDTKCIYGPSFSRTTASSSLRTYKIKIVIEEHNVGFWDDLNGWLNYSMGPSDYSQFDSGFYISLGADDDNSMGSSFEFLDAKTVGLGGYPTNLTSTPGYFHNNLSWEKPGQDFFNNYTLVNYTVYRGTNEGNLVRLATLGNVTWYKDNVATFDNITYYYAVTATWSSFGESIISNVVAANHLVTPEVSGLSSVSGVLSVNVSWDPLPDFVTTDYNLVRYTLYRGRYADALLPYAEVYGREWYRDDDPAFEPRTYYYMVTYYLEDIGGSKGSEVAMGYPITVPTEPREFSVRVGQNLTELTWKEPKWEGGMPIQGYDIYRKNNTGDFFLLTQVGPTSGTHTDPGLVPGFRYTYEISARSSIGEGPRARSAEVLMEGTPSSPEYINVVGRDALVDIFWNPPVITWGLDILEYRLYRGTDPQDMELYSIFGRERTNYTDIVENDRIYYYGISAVNRWGEGDMAGPRSTVASTVPGYPENLGARIGNGWVRVSWLAPFEDGGSPIVRYNIYRGMRTDEMAPIASVPFGQNSYHDTGVSNGHTYYYWISAGNQNGNGPLSDYISATPSSDPGAVPSLQVKADLFSARLDWGEPPTGGQDILEYRIYRGFSMHSISHISTVSALTFERSYKDQDLEYCHTYYYMVTAVNSIGESVPSPVVSVRPYGIPGIPDLAVLESDKNSITLRCFPPDDTGGAPVEAYRIYYRSDEEGSWNTYSSVTEKVDLLLLKEGATYTIQASTVTRYAESARSDEVTVTVGLAPKAPKDLKAENDRGIIDLSWEEALSKGTSVTSYRIYRISAGATHLFREVDGEQLSIRMVGLEIGRPYRFQITAVNVIGESEPSSPVDAVPMDVPGKIDEFRIEEEGDGLVRLMWSPPEHNGGSSIVSYSVYRGQTAGTETKITSLKGVDFFEDMNVENGATYYYLVSAVNLAGEGDQSDRLTAVPRGLPGSPNLLKATSTSDTVELQWEAPNDDGGMEIMGYLIYKGTDPEEMALFRSVGPQITQVKDEEVESGKQYYRVAAYNEVGIGEGAATTADVPSTMLPSILIAVPLILIPLLIAIALVLIPRIRSQAKEAKMRPTPVEEGAQVAPSLYPQKQQPVLPPPYQQYQYPAQQPVGQANALPPAGGQAYYGGQNGEQPYYQQQEGQGQYYQDQRSSQVYQTEQGGYQ